MGLKDYFEMGRQTEMNHARKAQMKQAAIRKKIVKKPAPYTPQGIIMGLGVLYQIVLPFLIVLKPLTKSIGGIFRRMFVVIRMDMRKVKERIYGVNPDWEKYKRFDELAKGEKK